MVVSDDRAVGNLCLQGWSRSHEEVSKDRAGGALVWVAEVVPPQSIVESHLAVDLPGVLNESAVRQAGGIPTVLSLFTSGRVVGNAGLSKHVVSGEIEQAVEVEGWLIVRSVEDLYVVGEESFISGFDVVRAEGVCQHIAPVVVMLDKVSLCE